MLIDLNCFLRWVMWSRGLLFSFIWLSLFVSLGFIVPLENFHSFGDVTIAGESVQILTCARHSWPLSSEGWFFSMPHLLWHEASVHNGHLRGPETLKPIAERVALELSLPLLRTKVCRGWDSNTKPSASVNALTHCATATVYMIKILPTRRKTPIQSNGQLISFIIHYSITY